MPWVHSVPAILEAWYPGQEGGYAIANLLLGNANPSGKLPVTFPVQSQDTPFYDAYAERITGVADSAFCGSTAGCSRIAWSEGIFMGYRWYDQQNIQPLFAFGEGLSYTTFEYSDLSAKLSSDDGVDLSFTIKNTGARKGDAVAEVYLGAGAVPSGVQAAKKKLVEFERVPLDPGQAMRVTVRIDKRRLAYWSTAAQDWVVASGPRTVFVGSSSRDSDLPLTASVTVP